MSETKGTVFNIQRYSIDDGPGIRTTVFVKGCPLRCPWCSNPESQNPKPELMYRYTACKHCGSCERACPVGAVKLDGEGNVHIDREACTVCGACVEACAADAMQMSGKVLSVDEVMKTIIRDEVYYEDGGGVTCSGGEILSQADFVAEIFEACQARGIHTNADTSGFGSADAMRKVLAHSDMVFFDMKLMDPEKHAEVMGVPLAPIIENLKIVAESGIETVIRFPLVPGYNDSDENLKAMADCIKEIGLKCRIDVLPYHKYGENKYAGVGMTYPIPEVPENTPANVERAVNTFKEYGLEAESSK